VTFTAEGARRVGLQTAPIRAERGVKVIPYEALIYDPDGKTFVYVATRPLAFERADVVVDRIADDRVLLSDGPPAGTEVVTVGAAEVHGTELEIAG
jgi:multidrug efflux pump subunit AcrA (membrane-fusion protein)